MAASILPPIQSISPRGVGPPPLYYDPHSPSAYGSTAFVINSHTEYRFTEGGLRDQGHGSSQHPPHRHTTSPGRDATRIAGLSTLNPDAMTMDEKRKAVLAASYNRQYTTEQLAEGVRHSSVPVGRKDRRRLHGVSALMANTPCIVHPGSNPVCSVPSSLSASSQHPASAASLPKLPPSTIDGIGHPAPPGLTLSRTTEPVFILNHKWGLEARRTLSPSPQHKSRSESQIQATGSSSPSKPPSHGPTNVSGGSGKQPQSPRASMAAPGQGRQSTVSPARPHMDGTAGAANVTLGSDSIRPAATYEPLSDDPLQLWRGRRLNKVEVKIEQRLHVLRVNPVARIEFEMKVKDLHHEKAEQEAIAAAKAAEAEARKARMIENFQARSTHHLVYRTDRSPGRRSRGQAGSRTGHAHGAAPPQNTGNAAKGGPNASRFHLYVKAVGGTLEEQAATVIQKNWRAYLAHSRYVAAILEASRKEAAELILHFLAHAASMCQHKAKAKAKQAQAVTLSRNLKGLNLKQPVRVALLMRQWTAVEGFVQQLCQKRTRGQAPVRQSTNGAAQPTAAQKEAAAAAAAAKKEAAAAKKDAGAATLLLKQSLAARKKGTMIVSTDPEKGIIDKLLTAEYAASRCFVTDRVLSDTLESVPQDVKGAVISVYLAHKKDAYIALLGLHWKAAARWKMQKRQNDMLAAARMIVDTGNGAAAIAEVPGVGPRPHVPLYRMLATAGELRALMQQGVYEGILYKTYLLKGNLSEYEQKLLQELASRAPPPGRRGAKGSTLQASSSGGSSGAPRMSVAGSSGPPPRMSASGATPVRMSTAGNRPAPLVIAGGEEFGAEPVAAEPAADPVQNGPSGYVGGFGGEASFVPVGEPSGGGGIVGTGRAVMTVAQQRQRWWREAEARTNRCLRKRYAMLNLDLVECLLDQVHTPPEAMAVQMVNLQ